MMAFITLAVIGFGLFWIHPALLILVLGIGLFILAGYAVNERERTDASQRRWKARQKELQQFQEREDQWQREREAHRNVLRVEIKGLPFWERRRIVERAFDEGFI